MDTWQIFELVLLILLATLSIIIPLIRIISDYKQQFSKPLRIIIMLFFMICPIFQIILLLHDFDLTKAIISFFFSTSWALGEALIYIYFVYITNKEFENTEYQFSKKFLYIFYISLFMFIFLQLYGSANVLLFYYNIYNDESATLADGICNFICLIIDSSLCYYLVTNFEKQTIKFLKTNPEQLTNESIDDPDSKFQKLARYSLLFGLSIISTLIWLLFSVVCDSYDFFQADFHYYWLDEPKNIDNIQKVLGKLVDYLNMIDCLTNIYCIFLERHNNGLYKKICCCHKLVINHYRKKLGVDKKQTSVEHIDEFSTSLRAASEDDFSTSLLN